MSRVVVLCLVFALPPVAEAQELSGAFTLYGPFGVGDLDGTLPPSAEVRVSLPIGERFAFEPFVTAGPCQQRRRGLEGFWGAQVRQRIVALSGHDAYAFATYGAAFYYDTRYDSYPIPAGHLGFGLHQRVAGALALRLEAHLVTFHVVPIGARYSAGLSVNLKR